MVRVFVKGGEFLFLFNDIGFLMFKE